MYVTPCSSTNALTGDGLDEAVQWLSGELYTVFIYVTYVYIHIIISA